MAGVTRSVLWIFLKVAHSLRVLNFIDTDGADLAKRGLRPEGRQSGGNSP
jgi:hypothetical protein